jgi:hypothetical protein
MNSGFTKEPYSRRTVNTLAAAFWDTPRFLDSDVIRAALAEDDPMLHRWILLRFLRHGRVVDTFMYFSLDEIRGAIDALREGSYERKKWRRLIEVYSEIAIYPKNQANV